MNPRPNSRTLLNRATLADFSRLILPEATFFASGFQFQRSMLLLLIVNRDAIGVLTLGILAGGGDGVRK